MQRDLTPQDVLPLIVEYLRQIGLKKTAKQLDVLYEHDETPLANKDLSKIIKHYIEQHPKLASKFIEKNEEEESQNEQEEEEEEEEKKQPKKIKKIQNGISKTIIQETQIESNFQKQKKFFQKCDDSVIHQLPDHLRDNTFEAKQKFGAGAGDAYGEFGNDKLKFTRGDNFKKEKGKLKNRQFQGMGSINVNAVNSIKL